MVTPLMNDKFRFCLILPQNKIPFEYGWQDKCNYKFNDKKLLSHNGNIGIVCGKGGIVVLDIDNKNYIKEFDKKLNTFSVETGSGGRHYYFICKDEFKKSFYVLNNSVGELRVKNCQVLIPGCKHPNGNEYKIFNDINIKEVSNTYLREMLGDLLSGKECKITDISRSGEDWKEVISMIEGGYNFDEVDNEMKLIGSSRWNNESLNYKLSTYCNALKKVKLE